MVIKHGKPEKHSLNKAQYVYYIAVAALFYSCGYYSNSLMWPPLKKGAVGEVLGRDNVSGSGLFSAVPTDLRDNVQQNVAQKSIELAAAHTPVLSPDLEHAFESAMIPYENILRSCLGKYID